MKNITSSLRHCSFSGPLLGHEALLGVVLSIIGPQNEVIGYGESLYFLLGALLEKSALLTLASGSFFSITTWLKIILDILTNV